MELRAYQKSEWVWPSAFVVAVFFILFAVVPFIPALFVTIFSTIFATFIPSLMSFFPALVGDFSAFNGPGVVMPIPIVAIRHPNQGGRHASPLDPLEVSLWPAGAVPAVGPAAPVPAVVEEHLFIAAFHHLDSGLHHHEGRSHGQTDIDVNPHLRASNRRTEDQKAGKGESELSHVWNSVMDSICKYDPTGATDE
jgi:hypothetical protein